MCDHYDSYFPEHKNYTSSWLEKKLPKLEGKDGEILSTSKGWHKPKGKAMRFNENKLQWSLVDWKAMEPMVRGLMFGAKKYTPDNWKEGLENKDVLDCLMRHLLALYNGELIDEESGVPHIGLLMCNAMFFSYFNPVTANVENNKKS